MCPQIYAIYKEGGKERRRVRGGIEEREEREKREREVGIGEIIIPRESGEIESV